MYHDLLVPHSSNADHTLADLSKNRRESCSDGELEGMAEVKDIYGDPDEDLEGLKTTVMMLIDTSGEDMEEDGVRGGSYRNSAEAEVVIAHVYRLYDLGLRPDQIGIITPYNGQLEVLRELVAVREAAKGNTDDGMTAKG